MTNEHPGTGLTSQNNEIKDREKMKINENVKNRKNIMEKIKGFIKKNLCLIIIFSVFIFLCHSVVYSFGAGYVKGRSLFMYKKLHSPFYIDEFFPDNTKGFRYEYLNLVRGAYSVVSFTVDGDDYEDYVDFISSSQLCKVGMPEYTGLKVIAAYEIEEECEYDNFPQESFKSVIRDNIEDYTILNYYSEGISFSSEKSFIATNEKTRRVIFYNTCSD